MGDVVWIAWDPPFAPHVCGRYEPRAMGDDGMPEPQKVQAQCMKCGASWQGTCLTGAVRTHIARFGNLHLHRDPFETPK